MSTARREGETTKRLSAAAMAWAGYVPPRNQPGGVDGPRVAYLLMCVALVFVCWRMQRPTVAPVPTPEHVCASENPWACEHQTNTAGKDVIIRHRDEAFCPISPDAPALVNAKP